MRAIAGIIVALSVVFGVVRCGFKKGSNKVLGLAENFGKIIDDDFTEK